MCASGALPFLLTQFGVAHCSPALQAAGWGLWFPGAGPISVGGVWPTALGFLFFGLFLTLGMAVWTLAGFLLLNIYLWALPLAGGALLATTGPRPYSWGLILAVTVATLAYKARFADGKHRASLVKRKLHEGYLTDEAARLEAESRPAQPAEARELSEDALRSIRYLFDMTLRNPGDFTGYGNVEAAQSSALRYSLDWMGYTLAMMQCNYMPSFHGYLNQAQRFIIDGFTRPEVCGYWKWEYLGGMLRWNPDPIQKHNIMFSGWSGLVVTLYGSNTGDLRYEAPGALRFMPSQGGRTYDCAAQDIVEVLVKQWRTYVTGLFPCEPHWTFPICNTFAMNAVLAYDQHHGTKHLEGVYDLLEKQLKENFILPSGEVA